MKNFCRIILALFLFLVRGIPATGQIGGSDRPPNILLILADDLGYSDIDCYGGGINTPNLDALAHDGIRFTNFYNSARCCPSRASLLTGLHPHQTGLGAMVEDATDRMGYQGEIGRNCVTLAEVLGQAGYRSYMAGKWHVTPSWDGSDRSNWPMQRGFHRYFGTIFGAGSYFDPRMLVCDNDTSSRSPDGFYYTDAISDSTVSFLQAHARDHEEEPFFMYVAYTAPHWPLHAKKEDISRYKGRFDAGWAGLREEKLRRMNALGLIGEDWDRGGQLAFQASWDAIEDKDWEIKRMEVYAAMVDCMDQGIGRIIRTLKESGALDNTIVLFLSDNGACAETWSPDNPWASRFGPEFTREGIRIDYSNDGSTDPGPPETYHSYGPGWASYSNLPFRGYKSGSYEGGISSPLIVFWPGKIKDKGGLRRQTSGIIDIMPTLLEVAGASYPEYYGGTKLLPFEGLSLAGTIRSDRPLERECYYVEHIGRRGLIHSSGLKLVKFNRRPWELYQLENDRTERTDLAGNHPEKVEELSGKWEQWARRAYVLPKPE